jgi:hypothetical protein
MGKMSDYEAVHTITDWYDGARRGIADFNGKPHYYENRWPEGADDWSEIYFLQPIDDATFALAMEDWGIWLRWDQARKSGEATLATHPALPRERQRHDEIEKILAERLVISPETCLKATAEFLYGQPTKVKWHVLAA